MKGEYNSLFNNFKELQSVSRSLNNKLEHNSMIAEDCTSKIYNNFVNTFTGFKDFHVIV